MINWEELKHIHVIRKLEEVLAQWFNTEIFFLDERGNIKNYDPLDRQRQFKNALCATLLPKDLGREFLTKFMADANEKILDLVVRKNVNCKDHEKFIFDGPFGKEKVFVSPIVVEGEYFGCVYAYCFLDKAFTDSDKKLISEQIQKMDIDPDFFDQTANRLRILNGSERKYFFELVELVSQEIVTFHMEISKREERISALNNELGERYSYNNMIGKSKPMQQMYALLDKIQTSESTVLIQGENGTGKELIAKAVHYNSPRKDGPFVTVNCSAFNDNLLESELFGHIKGAFTGAVKDKKGLFEAANHGTLFLDEIGDMTPAMQVKLLRVLQEGTLMPVGGTDQRRVNVRVLAATNKDLKEMVENGDFREDLYYRINVINIVVPPLRDRKEDIPLLLDHFVVRGCKEKNLPLKSFAKRALEKIYDFPWPGNIRELENEVERLIVLTGNEVKIAAEMLSPRIREHGGNAKVQGVRISGKLKDALEELEKTMIKEGLRRTKWNKSRLAKELGISRAGLIMKVEKYGLDKRKIMAAKAGGGGESDAA